MSLKLRFAFVCLLLSIASTAYAQSVFVRIRSSYAAFEIFRSSRLDMLGGEDVADPGPAAVLVNPAPLIEKDSANLSFDHADYFLDLSFNTYAAAVAHKNWVVDIAVQEVHSGPTPERTAFQPGGTGRTFETREWMAVVGLSYNLSSLLMPETKMRWSAGASWHNYAGSGTFDPGTANSFDLGTSASQRSEYAGGWTVFSGALILQNAFDNVFHIYGHRVHLRRFLRAGMSVTSAWTNEGSQVAPLAFTLTYSRDFELGRYLSGDSDHMGAEALLFHALALRYGYNSGFAGGRDSWGIGILLDDRLLKSLPMELELNLGRTSFDNEFFAGTKTIFGVRTQYQF